MTSSARALIATPDPAARDVEASIDTWKVGAAEYITYLRELGLDAGTYEALHRLFAPPPKPVTARRIGPVSLNTRSGRTRA